MIDITFTYINRDDDISWETYSIEPNINELLSLCEKHKDLHTILENEDISKYTKMLLAKSIISKYTKKCKDIYVIGTIKYFHINYSRNLGICNKVYLYDAIKDKFINGNKLII